MGMANVAIIDFGMGNLHSVLKAAEHAAPDLHIIVTHDADEIRRAERIIFPGQGAMGDCMQALHTRGLTETVLDVSQQKPFLGICVGYQMLFDDSEEQNSRGLGVLRGRVKHFPLGVPSQSPGCDVLKIPHMGWNQAKSVRSHPVWAGLGEAEQFYFVHSYYVSPAHDAMVLSRTQYAENFTSAVAKDNIVAVQFHPEKSARAGLQLLQNFIRWQP